MKKFDYPVHKFRILSGDTIDVDLIASETSLCRQQMPWTSDLGFDTYLVSMGHKTYLIFHKRCSVIGLETPGNNTEAGQLVTQCVREVWALTGVRRATSLHLDYSRNRFIGDLVNGKGLTLSSFLLAHDLAIETGKKLGWSPSDLTELKIRALAVLQNKIPRSGSQLAIS